MSPPLLTTISYHPNPCLHGFSRLRGLQQGAAKRLGANGLLRGLRGAVPIRGSAEMKAWLMVG